MGQYLFPNLQETIGSLEKEPSEQRKKVLQPLIDHLRDKIKRSETPVLQFICTHNSRRSQFAQVWAHALFYHFGIPVICHSGGTEVTRVDHRVVRSLENSGFEVSTLSKDPNPKYQVHFSSEANPIILFSKLFNDPVNEIEKPFAAIMTCSSAEENCPFIPGTEVRIPLNYEDPKRFDGTELEGQKYDERSRQIAAEILYLVTQIQDRS
ncbi:MAG: protein-tyrosine-phosphatase [Bacteroidota bacterium]|nr:protein-tyrosine-phosphatase [Bacteroidota bacterium]